MKTITKEHNIHELWKKYRIWLGLLILLLFAWAVFLYIYVGAIVPAAQQLITKPVIKVADDNKYYFEAQDGAFEIRQGFFSPDSRMLGLQIIVESKPEADAEQTVHAQVTLLDGMTKETVYTEDIVQPINGGDCISMVLDSPLEDIKGGYYELIVNFSGDSMDNIRVVGTTDKAYETWASTLNLEKAPASVRIDQYIDQGTFIATLYKVLVIFFSVFLTIFYIFVFIRKAKIEYTYLFTVLALGIMYCFIIIPFAVPDESMHASTVYRITNDLMGIPETDNPDTIYKRGDDAATELNNDCDLYQYYVVYHQMFSTVEDAQLYETGYRDTGVAGFLYAPAVVGVLAGRLLGLGTVPMYMLARLLTLTVFSLLTFFAMKKLPFGKTALFIICILPMTLQQAASVSYDAVVNAITILFTAICFFMAFSEDALKKKDMILAGVLGVGLIFAKSGAYLPLIILLAMIPIKKFGTVKRKWLLLVCFGAVLAAVFFVKNLGLVINEPATATLDASSEQMYSLGYILTHPGVIFNVGMGTLLLNTGYYISTMIGQRLGFLNIMVDDLVVYGFLLLLALSVLAQAEEKYTISVKQKWMMFLGICGSVALVLLSMWLFITPADSGVIQGVQGRYFIPVLWIILMLFKNKVIVLRKKIDSGLLMGAVFLHIFTFAYIFRDIFLA